MRFSWGRSCSRSLALPVLCRTHPAQRLFDAFVVLPVVVSVNRDEHLVAGMVLPMLGMDGLRRHAAVGRQRGEQARPGALPDRQGQAPGRRRARIHPDRRGRQPPPVPGRHQRVRKTEHRPHHQHRVRRMGQDLRRPQHGTPLVNRPHRPPRQDDRIRGRQLPQNPRPHAITNKHNQTGRDQTLKRQQTSRSPGKLPHAQTEVVTECWTP